MVTGCTEIISVLPASNILHSPPTVPFMSIYPTDYKHLPGWKSDNLAENLPVLIRSCSKIKRLPKNKPMGKFFEMGKVSDWWSICKAAENIRPGNETEARYFYETRFQPYTVSNNYSVKINKKKRRL